MAWWCVVRARYLYKEPQAQDEQNPIQPSATHQISPATMFSKSWSWDGSAKGVRPVRNSKQSTPRDHQSTASSCPMARMISGARYCLCVGGWGWMCGWVDVHRWDEYCLFF